MLGDLENLLHLHWIHFSGVCEVSVVVVVTCCLLLLPVVIIPERVCLDVGVRKCVSMCNKGLVCVAS